MEHIKRNLAVSLIYDYYGYCLEDLRYPQGRLQEEKGRVLARYMLMCLIYNTSAASENDIAEFMRCNRATVSLARKRINHNYYPGSWDDYTILLSLLNDLIGACKKELIESITN